VTDRAALVLIATALTMLVALQAAAVAGYLARRDHATTPQILTRAATAFAATLTLVAVLATALHTLAR
jgi:hypothetical protein